MKAQRKHYLLMAAIFMLTALLINLKFDLEGGYAKLIPCIFGFIGGVYIFAAYRTNN